jgi:hypothetical protein
MSAGTSTIEVFPLTFSVKAMAFNSLESMGVRIGQNRPEQERSGVLDREYRPECKPHSEV